jgi:uncharacterized protein YggE
MCIEQKHSMIKSAFNVNDRVSDQTLDQGGRVMKSKVLNAFVVAALALTVTACGKAGGLSTLAAGETASARGSGGGGGGEVISTSQASEGLVVVGTGTASAEPEVALITFGMELRGDDPAALVDQAARKMDQAIASAQELGIADGDIQTTGYNLWVENIYDPETGMSTGEVVYHLSHYVQATLRDLNQVGELLAAAVEAGANSISGVNFAVEAPGALVEQARQRALEDAAMRAKQMADGLEIALGKPILVMETGGGMPMEWGIGGGGDGMSQVVAPSISPGTFSVSVNIQVVYEIQ